MSLVLRHQPQTAGLTLDEAGWVSVDDLLAGMKSAGRGVSQETLERVVEENDKQRFQFNEDQTRIRATQGHSVEVELGYQQSDPPEVLCHGTPKQFVESIRREGLKKQKRHHVHLHADSNLASSVGQRRGVPVLLTIEAKRMAEAGYVFYVSPNDVWLTDHVPPEFIVFPERG
ncbi:UNVERIFIED_CONTAM: hypothetical protein GTU68_000457 [Idotea baltica]|nr:hypothetical protein [Idotea baltica]